MGSLPLKVREGKGIVSVKKLYASASFRGYEHNAVLFTFGLELLPPKAIVNNLGNSVHCSNA